jgi:hypothetical protein
VAYFIIRNRNEMKTILYVDENTDTIIEGESQEAGPLDKSQRILIDNNICDKIKIMRKQNLIKDLKRSAIFEDVVVKIEF